MNRNQFLESIAQTIQDYRKGEINQITPAHVDKWVKQFDVDDQITILSEIDRLLKRFYYSKERVKSSVRDFLANRSLFGTDPRTSLARTKFLHIQQRGESQTELLKVVDEILHEDYNLALNRCSDSDVYVYIDDCIYSGNRLRYDVVPWIKQNAPSGSKLVIYHIGRHKERFTYASKHIRTATYGKNITVNYYCIVEMDNWRQRDSPVEFMWPRLVSGDHNVDAYCERVRERCRDKGLTVALFRDQATPPPEGLFSSPHARYLVEKAFLKIGARLVMSSNNPAPSMRPLGFEKLESLGFGSLFITYRNIANNCPLALWFGNPEYSPPPHPLGSWYPLFPRRIYEEDITGSMIGYFQEEILL